MFKTLSPFNGAGHRTNNLKNAETEVTAIDDQRFSFVKVTFSKIPRHGSTGMQYCPESQTISSLRVEKVQR